MYTQICDFFSVMLKVVLMLYKQHNFLHILYFICVCGMVCDYVNIYKLTPVQSKLLF